MLKVKTKIIKIDFNYLLIICAAFLIYLYIIDLKSSSLYKSIL